MTPEKFTTHLIELLLAGCFAAACAAILALLLTLAKFLKDLAVYLFPLRKD